MTRYNVTQQRGLFPAHVIIPKYRNNDEYNDRLSITTIHGSHFPILLARGTYIRTDTSKVQDEAGSWNRLPGLGTSMSGTGSLRRRMDGDGLGQAEVDTRRTSHSSRRWPMSDAADSPQTVPNWDSKPVALVKSGEAGGAGLRSSVVTLAHSDVAHPDRYGGN